jgi:pSer/pThr/pTyr-binding forkhead associated (FHA) protein
MTAPESGTHSTAYIIYEFERRAYAVTDSPVRIGRDASNDIVLRETAVSRFNTEVRLENGACVLHSEGSTPALIDGVPIAGDTPLTEGARIEIGSAVLTFTEKRLPIGVSIVERAKGNRGVRDDVANRRDTIKNPLIKGTGSEPPSDPQFRVKILMAIAAVVALLYLLGR